MPQENKGFKSFGSLLKESRVAKNISIEEASKHTRIHVNILKAIEADDVKSLGNVYAKSFLKLYAEYLGVNKEDVLASFAGAQGQEVLTSPKVRFPVEQELKNRGLSFVDKVIAFFASVSKKVDFKILFFVLIVLFVVWGLAKIIGHRRNAPRAFQQAEVKKASVKRDFPFEKPVFKAVDAAVKAQESRTEASAAVSSQKVSEEKVQKNVVLVIRAKEKSWLQVKVDGKVVFQSVLSKGAAESWQAVEKIELWLGNAGAVQLELNGRLLQKIGRPGQTLKHVVVTKAGLSIRG